MPEVHDSVLGVVNVLGQIIPVVNIRRHFRLPLREMELSDRLIIAKTSKRNVALLVDSVSEVAEYPEEKMISSEKILPGMEYIRGVVKNDDGMILVVDPETILSREDVKSIDEGLKENTGG